MSKLMLALLLVSFAGAGWMGFIALPRAAIGGYRSRLWKIRDDLVDEILAGRIRHVPAAQDLVHHLETRITIAASLNPFRMLGISLLVLRDGDRDELRKLNQYDPAKYLELRPFTDRMNKADARHLFVGSFSGWALTLSLIVVAILFAPLVIIGRTARRIRTHRETQRPTVPIFAGAMHTGSVTVEAGYERILSRVVGDAGVADALTPERDLTLT
jgi:hypothetical protein